MNLIPGIRSIAILGIALISCLEIRGNTDAIRASLLRNDTVIEATATATPEHHEVSWFLAGRLRYEYADEEGRKDSNAFTLRNRAGIQADNAGGFSFLAELEHTWAVFGEDGYLPFPGPGGTVIADPENLELNRLQIGADLEDLESKVTIGRQVIILDDARFIGDVGWRQNQQTYDAVRIETTSLGHLKLDYAYLWQVNRIFGEEAPSKTLSRFKSDSHLFNLRFKEYESGRLTLFTYLLNFDEAPALSTQTFGARYNGSTAQSNKRSYIYDFQWAIQQDYERNVSDYSVQYLKLEGGVQFNEGVNCGLGYEVLGDDNGVAFQAPLGTNHKFNGFADAFLTTPASGLNDFYTWIGGNLPGQLAGRLAFHHFLTNAHHVRLGNEVDVSLSHKWGEHASALFKAARLYGSGPQPNLTRISIQTDYSF